VLGMAAPLARRLHVVLRGPRSIGKSQQLQGARGKVHGQPGVRAEEQKVKVCGARGPSLGFVPFTSMCQKQCATRLSAAVPEMTSSQSSVGLCQGARCHAFALSVLATKHIVCWATFLPTLCWLCRVPPVGYAGCARGLAVLAQAGHAKLHAGRRHAHACTHVHAPSPTPTLRHRHRLMPCAAGITRCAQIPPPGGCSCS